jgi:hypothetical protein
MTLDHYIPKCLTRPWHDPAIGRESLRFFDFDTGEFGHRNSGRLFARHNVNAPATEAYLNRYIETPFAIMQDKIVAAAGDMAKVEAAFNELPHTALVGLYYLQVQRIRDATGPRGEHHLDEFAQRGFEWLQQLSAAVYEKDDAMLYAVRTAMYFPETAIFPVPLVDQMPALVLPIDTAFAIVFADKSTNREMLDEAMTSDFMPTFYSIALKARRIIIPPALQNPAPEMLVGLRQKLRELFKLISEAAMLAGMPVWRVDD